MSEQKQVYRIEAKRHRERMDIRDEDPETAAKNFIKSIKPEQGSVIGVYWPKGREIDTSDLLHLLIEQGHSVALPVMQKNSRILKYVIWHEQDELVKGEFDILQPAVTEATEYVRPNIVVVPMLAFDRKGHRLGYGGGFYDATLSALRADKPILAVGYAYSKQAVLFNLPAEDHDQALDWVITPKDVHCYQSDGNKDA